MAKNKPVAIWVTRHNPKMDPKFHQAEILIGAGRSTKALLAILIRGWVFRKLSIIEALYNCFKRSVHFIGNFNYYN